MMTINEILAYSGLTKAAFSRLYKIPLRTLEDWTAGRKLPRSEYIFYLLERCVKYDKETGFLNAAIDIQMDGAKRVEGGRSYKQ